MSWVVIEHYFDNGRTFAEVVPRFLVDSMDPVEGDSADVYFTEFEDRTEADEWALGVLNA